MFSSIIALCLRLERISLCRSSGVLLGAGAVVLLIGPEASLQEPDKAVFVLLALVAPFCSGAEGNYIATRTPDGVNSVMALLGASAFGCLIAWPLAVSTDSWVELFKPWESAEWALLLSSLCHGGAYSRYVWLVGTAGAVFAIQIAYIVTVSAVLLSTLVLDESYSVGHGRHCL